MNILKKATMASMSNVLAKQDSNLASYMKTVDVRLNDIMAGINQNSSATQQLTNEFETVTNS